MKLKEKNEELRTSVSLRQHVNDGKASQMGKEENRSPQKEWLKLVSTGHTGRYPAGRAPP